MKRKIIIVLLVILTVFCFNACASDNNGLKKQSSSKESGKIHAYLIGDKIKTAVKSESDGKKHKVVYKVAGIITDSKSTRKIIKKYNLSASEKTISESPGKNMMYAVMSYSVRYPDSFPAEEYGIRHPELQFRIVGEDGKKEIKYKGTVYEGIGDTQEIGKEPSGYDFYPGDTYKGKIVYMLPKGCGEYLIKEGKHYISPKQ